MLVLYLVFLAATFVPFHQRNGMSESHYSYAYVELEQILPPMSVLYARPVLQCAFAQHLKELEAHNAAFEVSFNREYVRHAITGIVRFNDIDEVNAVKAAESGRICYAEPEKHPTKCKKAA